MSDHNPTQGKVTMDDNNTSKHVVNNYSLIIPDPLYVNEEHKRKARAEEEFVIDEIGEERVGMSKKQIRVFCAILHDPNMDINQKVILSMAVAESGPDMDKRFNTDNILDKALSAYSEVEDFITTLYLATCTPEGRA